MDRSQSNGDLHYGLSLCPPEVFHEILHALAIKNSSEMLNRKRHMLNRLRMPSQVVAIIFDLCKALDVDNQIKWAAVELVDQFLVRHIRDVHEEYHQRSVGTREDCTWELVEKNMAKQLTLRIVTCILIASKVHAKDGSLH